MTLDHRFQLLTDVRNVVSVAVYPVQAIVNFPVSAGEWMDESFSTRESLLSELTSLKKKKKRF